MRFMLRVEVADVTADWAVVGRAPALARPPAGRPMPPRLGGSVAGAGPGTASYAAVARARTPAASGFAEVLVPAGGARRGAGRRPAGGHWALEALRVAAGVRGSGLETDHRTIPHEVDWLRTAVHLEKGCYRGQETVARVHNLGRPPRRLVFLHLDGSEHTLPAHGDPVLLGERQVGFVTTAARHHELGPIALALVKRSAPVDAPLVAARRGRRAGGRRRALIEIRRDEFTCRRSAAGWRHGRHPDHRRPDRGRAPQG